MCSTAVTLFGEPAVHGCERDCQRVCAHARARARAHIHTHTRMHALTPFTLACAHASVSLPRAPSPPPLSNCTCHSYICRMVCRIWQANAAPVAAGEHQGGRRVRLGYARPRLCAARHALGADDQQVILNHLLRAVRPSPHTVPPKPETLIPDL